LCLKLVHSRWNLLSRVYCPVVIEVPVKDE